VWGGGGCVGGGRLCREAAVAFLKIIFQNFTGASGESYELAQPAQVVLESGIEHGISLKRSECPTVWTATCRPCFSVHLPTLCK
jgi:hypothetical protein